MRAVGDKGGRRREGCDTLSPGAGRVTSAVVVHTSWRSPSPLSHASGGGGEGFMAARPALGPTRSDRDAAACRRTHGLRSRPCGREVGPSPLLGQGGLPGSRDSERRWPGDGHKGRSEFASYSGDRANARRRRPVTHVREGWPIGSAGVARPAPAKGGEGGSRHPGVDVWPGGSVGAQ